MTLVLQFCNKTCTSFDYQVTILKALLKVPGPISQNGVFYSNDVLPPKKSWFQISVKSVFGLDT